MTWSMLRWLRPASVVVLAAGAAAFAGDPKTEDFAAVAESLRRAIADLTDTFGGAYPKGTEYARRLDRLERRFRQTVLPRETEALLSRLRSLQREALAANPLLSAHPILFAVRPQYRPDHHNTATMFQTG